MHTNEEYVIDLSSILLAIRSHILILVLVTVMFGAAGFGGASFFLTPKYESSINMIVNTTQESNTSITNDNVTTATKLVSTYAIIVKSNTVLDEVINNLDLNMTYEELENAVSVTAVDNTQIMRVAVTNTDNALSQAIVEEIAEVAPDAIVSAIEAGSCKVVSKVMYQEKPVSPNIPKLTILAALAGLMCGLLLIVIREITKVRKVVEDKDIEDYLGLTVLSVIPDIEDGKGRK